MLREKNTGMRGEKDREGDAFSPDFRGEIGIDLQPFRKRLN
jgi:hypothetical protein